MAIEIQGNWQQGLAYDIHSIRSDLIAPNRWLTQRSKMGELLYRLKYRNRTIYTPLIVKLLLTDPAILDLIKKTDVIVPIPPSKQDRPIQPVFLLARMLSKVTKQPVIHALKKNAGAELKNTSVDKKQKQLKGMYLTSEAKALKGKRVLLLDDLYCSGATLSRATALLNHAGCQNVFVLTLTKTRSKR